MDIVVMHVARLQVDCDPVLGGLTNNDTEDGPVYE